MTYEQIAEVINREEGTHLSSEEILRIEKIALKKLKREFARLGFYGKNAFNSIFGNRTMRSQPLRRDRNDDENLISERIFNGETLLHSNRNCDPATRFNPSFHGYDEPLDRDRLAPYLREILEEDEKERHGTPADVPQFQSPLLRREAPDNPREVVEENAEASRLDRPVPVREGECQEASQNPDCGRVEVVAERGGDDTVARNVPLEIVHYGTPGWSPLQAV